MREGELLLNGDQTWQIVLRGRELAALRRVVPPATVPPMCLRLDDIPKVGFVAADAWQKASAVARLRQLKAGGCYASERALERIDG